jgi:NAD+ kinase
MKAAVYSRVFENSQKDDVQLFFDELAIQKIEAVVYHDFFQQIKTAIQLPASIQTFANHEE